MKTQKQRRCYLHVDEDGSLILTIRQTENNRETVDHYRVERNSAPGVLAFRLMKLTHSDEGEVVYDVLLKGMDENDFARCDCIGWEQWGHCRHVESLQALIQAGRLK